MSGQKQEGAAAPSHTDLPCTVEDALKALDSASNEGLALVGRFLEALAVMSKRADHGADDYAGGRIVEGAYQSGFRLLDDNAGLFVVSEADLVAFVKNCELGIKVAVLMADSARVVGEAKKLQETFDAIEPGRVLGKPRP